MSTVYGAVKVNVLQVVECSINLTIIRIMLARFMFSASLEEYKYGNGQKRIEFRRGSRLFLIGKSHSRYNVH